MAGERLADLFDLLAQALYNPNPNPNPSPNPNPNPNSNPNPNPNANPNPSPTPNQARSEATPFEKDHDRAFDHATQVSG